MENKKSKVLTLDLKNDITNEEYKQMLEQYEHINYKYGDNDRTVFLNNQISLRENIEQLRKLDVMKEKA